MILMYYNGHAHVVPRSTTQISPASALLNCRDAYWWSTIVHIVRHHILKF